MSSRAAPRPRRVRNSLQFTAQDRGLTSAALAAFLGALPDEHAARMTE